MPKNTDELVNQFKTANSEYLRDVIVSQIMYLNEDFILPEKYNA